jgi:putative aminopeptidase FrvX
MMDAAKDGSMLAGKGPAIEYTPQNHRGINKMLREVADKNKIPLQLIVGSTGNDTIAFFLENTITAILATPLKYMHTTTEMAHRRDVKRAIKMFVEFLLELTPDKINRMNNKN